MGNSSSSNSNESYKDFEIQTLLNYYSSLKILIKAFHQFLKDISQIEISEDSKKRLGKKMNIIAKDLKDSDKIYIIINHIQSYYNDINLNRYTSDHSKFQQRNIKPELDLLNIFEELEENFNFEENLDFKQKYLEFEKNYKNELKKLNENSFKEKIKKVKNSHIESLKIIQNIYYEIVNENESWKSGGEDFKEEYRNLIVSIKMLFLNDIVLKGIQTL